MTGMGLQAMQPVSHRSYLLSISFTLYCFELWFFIHFIFAISCFSSLDVNWIQMVQQTIDYSFSEYVMGNIESDLPNHDKQLPVAVKKSGLRDLHNEYSCLLL